MSASGSAAPPPHASNHDSPLLTSGLFVVLYHEVPPGRERGSHWDLMLDTGSVLRTWALDHFPTIGQDVTALPLPDHRRWYLTYEGPLTPDERGDRGRVTRVAAGTYHLREQSLARCVFDLCSDQITGRATLIAEPERATEPAAVAAAAAAAGTSSRAAVDRRRCRFLLTEHESREGNSATVSF